HSSKSVDLDLRDGGAKSEIVKRLAAAGGGVEEDVGRAVVARREERYALLIGRIAHRGKRHRSIASRDHTVFEADFRRLAAQPAGGDDREAIDDLRARVGDSCAIQVSAG